MNFLMTYLSVAGTFKAIDLVWLRSMAEKLYRLILGDLLRSKPNLFAANLFCSLPDRTARVRRAPRSLRGWRPSSFCLGNDVRRVHLCHPRSHQPGDITQLVDGLDDH